MYRLNGAYNCYGLVDQVMIYFLSVSVGRVNFVFSIAGFTGGGKPYPKTRETATLRRDIQKASRT